jgi:hypothetical protein
VSGRNLSDPREPVELFLDNLEGEISALQGVLKSKEVAVPQRGQKELIRSLLRVCDWIRDAFRAERTEREGATPDQLVSLGRRYRLLISDVQTEFLPYLVETDEAYCPPEIGMAVERVVSGIEANSVVLLHPSDSAVPRIRAVKDLEERFLARLRPYAPSDATPAENQGRLYVFLSYPQVMARSPLIHTIILGHEIEHLEDWNTGLSEGLSSAMDLTPKDFDALVEDLKNLPVGGQRGALPPVTFGELFTHAWIEARVGERWSQIRDDWLTEIVSDLLAVWNFGPAYFFALGLWSLPIGVMYSHSDSHPCSRLRLTLMGQELRSMGLTHYSAGPLGTARAHFDQWNTLLRDPRPTEGELIHHVAGRSVRRAFPRIREAVRRAPTARSALTSGSKDDIAYAVRLLRHGAPPAEIPQPSDRGLRACELATIFNAYFIFQSAHLNDLYELLHATSDGERREALIKLDKLILKAVEGSEVRKVWDAKSAVPPGEGALHAD